MKRKGSIPKIEYIPAAPEVLKENTPEETAAKILTSIRQLEPEDQNEVVKGILKELAIDRRNSVRQYREAAERACKNMEVFMYNAIDLEKTLAETAEKSRV